MNDSEGTFRLTAQIIGEIIRKQLCLEDDAVWLRDQNRVIPNDKGVYVIVGMINVPTVIASVSSMRAATAEDWDETNKRWDLYGVVYDAAKRETNFDSEGQTWDEAGQTFDQQPETMVETTEVYQREDIQIDFLSRSNAGITRNWEIQGALTSFLSQRMQEKYAFKIFKQPNGPLNTSYAEGGSQLNRYTFTIPTFVWYKKEAILQPDEYFDSFGVRVDDESTIATVVPYRYDKGGEYDQPGQVWDQLPPLAEFVINQQGIQR